jgi:DNA repair exonuclease SbcCD ATPase subunit
MKAADQRVIIEQLLGVTLLSEKADTLKELIKSTKDAITQESAEIEATKKSNDRIQQSIDTLLTRQRAWNTQKDETLTKIANAIVELENVDIEKELVLHAELAEYDAKRARSVSLHKERATLESAIAQADRTQKKYLTELESLANKQCHACEQALHDHKHEEMTATATANLEEAQRYATKLLNDYKKIHDEIEEIGEILQRPNTYYDTLEQALKHQNNLKSLESQLESKAVEVDPYQEQIDELRNTAMQEISWDTVNELTTLKDHQEFLLKLLTNKDSFIRKKIIDQNLAYLNNRLTHYLDAMGLPHTVTFLNDLTVEITQLGQDLDFDNLSRGERTRLILSLSLAFRDVWENLYQQVSLLFVDELIDNGLDASGVEGALATLKKISRERKKNVFLISHKDELVGRVNNVLKVIKENGFTSYANDLEITDEKL